MLIEESFSDDVIRSPFEVEGPALPGAQEWNPASLQVREGVVHPRGRRPLTDDNRPGPSQAWSLEGLVSNLSNPLPPGHSNTPLGASTTLVRYVGPTNP